MFGSINTSEETPITPFPKGYRLREVLVSFTDGNPPLFWDCSCEVADFKFCADGWSREKLPKLNKNTSSCVMASSF